MSLHLSKCQLLGITCHSSYMGLGVRKTCLRGFGNTKGADQPAHQHSLISTFVIRLLESIIQSTLDTSNFKGLSKICRVISSSR